MKTCFFSNWYLVKINMMLMGRLQKWVQLMQSMIFADGFCTFERIVLFRYISIYTAVGNRFDTPTLIGLYSFTSKSDKDDFSTICDTYVPITIDHCLNSNSDIKQWQDRQNYCARKTYWKYNANTVVMTRIWDDDYEEKFQRSSFTGLAWVQIVINH